MQGNPVSCPLTDSLAATPAAGSKKRKQTDLSWEIEIRREGDLIREVGKGLRCGRGGCRAGI